MDKCTRKSRREEGWGDRVILFLLDYVFSCFKDMTLLQKSSSIDMNEYTKEETNMSITLFISTTMFCGIDNILQNISHI